MTVDRPDPDALLKRVMAEEERECRGRLKLFLGYASRVGKTQKMLDEMRRRRDRGQDVLVAWVQEDEDPEVRRLLMSLETMPPAIVHGQATLDIEGLLRRHPEVVAVDGLAHTNPPGSRNANRWQDIDELLSAGIHVLSAVNVQYIEGLQEDIERLLGVRKEVSVPDAFIRKADEVVLVDLNEAEVVARSNGKAPMTAEQLSSLREMALLYTADRIDQAVEDYRLEHHIEHVWGTQERILVCITGHERGPALVERGRRTAERMHAQLYAIYVTPDREWSNVSHERRVMIQNTIALARTYQAQVEVVEAHEPAQAILDFAHQHHITQIFLGHSARSKKWFGLLSRSVVGRILKGAHGIDVHVASDQPVPPSLSMEMRRQEVPAVPLPVVAPRRRRTDRSDSNRGKLKVYLGYAAGVGKTYQMLENGNKMKAQGIDVVVGYFEPHGRLDTIKQIGNLEMIPRRHVEYRDHGFEEMDVDAILARKPAVCLVDELAHANVPGSANEKRWEDVEVLRDHGIDVVTTVNIQHLESLNDCVYHVTGVHVRETVPDQIVSEADEIILIDVTTRALLNRLKRGVVYSPEKAQQALQNFFKEGSLTALRELALRQTADTVEIGLQKLAPRRSDDSNVYAVMACIGPHGAGPTLVRRAKRMADRLNARCYVVHAYNTTDWEHAPPNEREHVEQVFTMARTLNIETCLLPGRDTARALIEFAREHNITQLFLGRGSEASWQYLFGRSLVERVIKRVSGVDVHVVADTEK